MYYKAPELYFNNPGYDYRVDIWPVGLILAGMVCTYILRYHNLDTQVFKKTPFLVGNDGIDQILKLGRLVGTRNMIDYIKQYRLFERKGNHICADLIIASQNGDIRE